MAQELANLTSPLACIRQWPSVESREWADGAVAQVLDDPHVDTLVAIGSAVREIGHCEDVDFVLVFHHAEPSLPIPPIDVDVSTYERAVVETLISSGHDLLGWGIRFGRVIYERNRYWTRLRAHWDHRLPFPSAEAAMQRAAEAERLLRELSEMGDEDAAHEQLITMLTQLARGALIRDGAYPASRPELPAQLREVGRTDLAQRLARALEGRSEARVSLASVSVSR